MASNVNPSVTQNNVITEPQPERVIWTSLGDREREEIRDQMLFQVARIPEPYLG